MQDQLLELIEAVGQLSKKVAESDAIIPNVAKCYSRMKLELMNEGFTREEAMQIISQQGVSFLKQNN